MQWFKPTYLVVIAALISVPLLAPQTNGLRAYPVAVGQEAAPAKPAEQQRPAGNENPSAGARADDSTSSSTAVPSGKTPKPEGTVFVSRVNEVPVVFTVTDKHNHYIRDLNKSDFKVIDDGRLVQDIRSFRRETDLPLRVGLLIDSSASVRGRFKFEQESAIEFMRQTIRPGFDQAFIMGFNSKLEITQEFTDAGELLSKGIRSLRPGTSTRLYDALYYACRERMLQKQESIAVRKAIVLITDGDDNSSHTTREEAIDMALRANVIVYTISTNYSEHSESRKYNKLLERIAEATGGQLYEPSQVTDVSNAFAQIQADLRSQYALAYHPADFRPDGRYRTIKIVAEPKGLKVHSRYGYYAPAE